MAVGPAAEQPEPLQAPEDALWRHARSQLRQLKAPESLRARISAMLAVERAFAR